MLPIHFFLGLPAGVILLIRLFSSMFGYLLFHSHNVTETEQPIVLNSFDYAHFDNQCPFMFTFRLLPLSDYVAQTSERINFLPVFLFHTELHIYT